MIKRISFLICLLVLASCDESNHAGDVLSGGESQISGEAQGTTYSVKFLNPDSVSIAKAQIDSILDAIDQSLSSWVDSSTLSLFNRADSIRIDDPHFLYVFFRGSELSKKTDGAFHPMVMPLVRAWGFGPEGGQVKEGINLDSIRSLVTYDFSILPADSTEESWYFVKKPGIQMDVNSYAQGYSVDVVADFLESKNIQNYMVEIGGELRTKGLNQKEKLWRVGIDRPVEDAETRELTAVVPLENAALATSGTYRKFYEKDGRKYSHTIDPATASPVAHNLLSVTVLTQKCLEADAYATAFMVMGVDKTMDFLKKHPEENLEVHLIFDGGVEGIQTYTSPGLKDRLEIL